MHTVTCFFSPLRYTNYTSHNMARRIVVVLYGLGFARLFIRNNIISLKQCDEWGFLLSGSQSPFIVRYR